MTEPLTAPAYELAQVNIGRLQFPLDSPELKDFVDALDPVNATVDAAEGFVWRLQSDSGNATDVPVLGDEWLIINMSVWRDPNALTAFMYQGRHRELLAKETNLSGHEDEKKSAEEPGSADPVTLGTVATQSCRHLCRKPNARKDAGVYWERHGDCL